MPIRFLSFGILSCCLLWTGFLRAQEASPPPEATPEATPEAAAVTADAASEVRPGRRFPGGRRFPDGRRRPMRGRARLPQGVFGEEHLDLPVAADTVLGGTVPAIWEIERSHPEWDDADLPLVIERDSLAPSVPLKVIRYAEWLISHYDTDADGALNEEEWKKMPGAPQSIDIDGDGRITLEELIRHLALYGRERTIHRPVPVQRYHQPMLSGDFQLFHPVAPPPPPTPEPVVTATPTEGEAADDVEKKESTGPRSDDLSADMTEESMAADEKELDDDTYEEIIAGRQVPAEKKYSTPPELYKGLPAWFFFRDRDGDGQVSMVEFAPTLKASALALFGKLDKNGDGFITPDELRAPPAPTPEPEAVTPAAAAAPTP